MLIRRDFQLPTVLPRFQQVAVELNADTAARDQWLTMGLARTLLGINEATLRHWADHGLVRAFRTPGGHRRFAAADIQALLDSASKPEAAMSLADDHSVLPRIRRRVNTAKPHQPTWMTKFSTQGYDEMRELGHTLLDLCASYVDRADKRALADAAQFGRRYGDAAAGSGLSLQEALEAFVFFRSATMKAVKPALVRRGRAPEDLFTAMELVGRITDSVLVGLASAYEREQT